ncbi:MAG: helix-turn-helix transcriptional regulator [Kofleriaceae bacterium]
MPQFSITRALEGHDVSAIRAVCDGCDAMRLCEEHCDHAMLWFVTGGRFELRDRNGVQVMDPTQGIILPAGHGFTIKHPAGPDVCVAFRGPIVDQLAGAGSRRVAVPAALAARLGDQLKRWRDGAADSFAVAELLAAISAEPCPVEHRDLVSAIVHVLRVRFAESLTLEQLSDHTGYSVFHACRAFRATTGSTIAGFRRELRLRHALARLLDGDEPLIEVAAATGFASQAHLTNLFRARFGITPARARSAAGRRALAELPTLAS